MMGAHRETQSRRRKPESTSAVAIVRGLVLGLLCCVGASTAGTAQRTTDRIQEAADDLGIELADVFVTVDERPRTVDAGVPQEPDGPPVIPVTLVLQDGDMPAGGGGNSVTTLNAPFTDGNGKVGFTGVRDNDDRFVWHDTGIVWRNSDSVSPLLTGAESTMGVGDAGDFIYSPAADGADAVWSDAGLVAEENVQAPGFPAGTNSTFHSRPTMLPGGRAHWVAGFDDTGGTSTQGRVLYTSPTASSGDIAVVLRSDDMVGGFTIDRPSGIGFDYQVSDNALHLVIELLMDTGSTTNDGFVYVDGTLVARESEPTGDGDNWDNFDVVSINDAGNHLFTGDTDGSTSSDEFVAYNGTIGIREGDTVGGVELTSAASLRAASLNNLGEAVHLWGISGGDEILFFACDARYLLQRESTAILRTGDMVDVDGGGADATITDFNTSTVTGPGLWLAEDGRVHVEVDLDYGAGDLEAIIALDLPVCGIFADGFESGDISAWSSSIP